MLKPDQVSKTQNAAIGDLCALKVQESQANHTTDMFELPVRDIGALEC